MPKKVFVDEPNEEVVEAPKPKKERKKRAPLTPEQKQALVERLAKARLAKKNAKKPQVNAEPVVEKPVVEKPKRKPRAKPTPKDDNYLRQQTELNDYRHQLELQKLKNELDQARSRTNKTVAKVEPVDTSVEEPKEIIVKDEPTVDNVERVVDNTPTPPPQSRTRNIANSGNIWNMIRNS
tara:strand:- start:237 stop:776 length:540 start_codon:yes stop_codon:yes gene_type:complete